MKFALTKENYFAAWLGHVFCYKLTGWFGRKVYSPV